jgi:hypothetical protein
MMPATEIPKNAAETIRVERAPFNGVDLLHVRCWTGRPGDPNAKPTPKGLSLRPEVWREVLPAVAALLEGGGDDGGQD